MFLFLFFCLNGFSQSPQKFNYQSVVRKLDGSVLKLEDLGIQWSGWTKNESTGKQGVQYGALTVPLIKAVQEQQEIIEGLNKRLEKIERMLVNSNK